MKAEKIENLEISAAELEEFLAYKAEKAKISEEAENRQKLAELLAEVEKLKASLPKGSKARPTQPAGPKNKAVWSRVEQKIMEGKTNEQILAEICEENGNDRTSLSCIRWYRTTFQKTGTCRAPKR